MSDTKNQIRLMPVKDLLGMNFFIPGYQRGYRWKTRQVEDLLDDIYEFMQSGRDGKYCLQPLVVKKSPIEEYSWIEKRNKLSESQSLEELVQKTIEFQRSLQRWDVVDGQQRLTTTFILLSFLMADTEKSDLYTIEYETRKGSSNYLTSLTLNDFAKSNATTNIDYWHMYNTYRVIDKWFKNTKVSKEKFKVCLLENTEFIWYETDEDPIEVFTRLNIGKISLTNAELVKALFLNDSNYKTNNIGLRKSEIAILWDHIEYTLQRNEFWNFIHDNNYDQPTRIDFILELVMNLKNPQAQPNKKKSPDNPDDFWIVTKKLGSDGYRTFRYFYQLFEKIRNKESDKTYNDIWKEITQIFNIFVEWHNDLDCYHYIGFLVACEDKKKFKIDSYLKKWSEESSKKVFIENLINDIYNNKIDPLLKKIGNDQKQKNAQWYDYVFEKDKGLSKTECFPLLLLFNVQTIINKNRYFKENSRFNASEFKRFPFHLFKNEKGWDIEHIASNTENNLKSNEEKKNWLESIDRNMLSLEMSDRIDKIIDLFSEQPKEAPSTQGNLEQKFNELRKELEAGNLDDDERNKIWNFCLLDQSTNRSYGNSIFASKRKEILERDQKGYEVRNKNESKPIFILECTKNVFTKYYSTDVTDLRAWTEKDAEQYLKCIYETLKDFNLKNPYPQTLQS